MAGSVYSYAGRSIGDTAGFIAGWALLLDYVLMPALGYLVCAIALHAEVPIVPEWVWIVLLTAFSMIANYLGIEAAARTNLVMLVLQLAIVAIVCVAAVLALTRGVDGARISLAPLFNPSLLTPGLIFGALSLAVLSFLGFDAISTLSEEAIGGAKAIGQATILSRCICACCSWRRPGLPPCSCSAARISRPALKPMRRSMPSLRSSAARGSSSSSRSLAWFLALSPARSRRRRPRARLIYSMARDSKLPHLLAHVHPTRKVPERAILLVAAVTLVLGISIGDKFELLASLVSFGALIGFLLLHASVIVQFHRSGFRKWLRTAGGACHRLCDRGLRVVERGSERHDSGRLLACRRDRLLCGDAGRLTQGRAAGGVIRTRG